MTGIDREALEQALHEAYRVSPHDTLTFDEIADAVIDHLRATAHPATAGDECGAWGGCPLPRGHNMGRADIPENHAAPPTRGEDGLRAEVERLHGGTHWCFDGDNGPNVYERGHPRFWPCPTYAALAAHPATAGDGDLVCHECGKPNPVWWAPDDLWNATVGTPDNPRGEGVILCPSCFCARVAAPAEPGGE